MPSESHLPHIKVGGGSPELSQNPSRAAGAQPQLEEEGPTEEEAAQPMAPPQPWGAARPDRRPWIREREQGRGLGIRWLGGWLWLSARGAAQRWGLQSISGPWWSHQDVPENLQSQRSSSGFRCILRRPCLISWLLSESFHLWLSVVWLKNSAVMRSLIESSWMLLREEEAAWGETQHSTVFGVHSK